MISERIKQLAPSLTLEVSAKAKELKSQGIDVIDFGAGEPDSDSPFEVKQAGIEAIQNNFTHYTAVGGIDELKQVIVNKFRIENNIDYTPEQILVSSGAKHSIHNIMQALLNLGDEVLIPLPYWVSYPEQVKLAQANPILVESNQDFKVTPELLKEKLTNQTKLLILNSPNNPSGAVYTKNELQALADFIIENNLLVLSDEIYEKLIYETEHISIASLNEEIKNRTIVVNGVSKSYAMTGWRIGYCAGPVPIIKAATKYQGQTTSNPTSISQKAAIAALNSQSSFVQDMKQEYEKRMNYVHKVLNTIPGIKINKPAGAFYFFIDVSNFYNDKIKDSISFSKLLLDKVKVVVVPGAAFGMDNFIRISYSIALEDIEKGLQKLKYFCEESFFKL